VVLSRGGPSQNAGNRRNPPSCSRQRRTGNCRPRHEPIRHRLRERCRRLPERAPVSSLLAGRPASRRISERRRRKGGVDGETTSHEYRLTWTAVLAPRALGIPFGSTSRMAERRMFCKWHLADAGVPLLTLSGGDHICYIRDLGKNQNHIAAGNYQESR